MTPLDLYPWQESLEQWWQTVCQQGRIPHAIMLSGAKGSGKRHVADQLCRALYAGNDQALALYQAGTHPDFFPVNLEEKKKEISVAQIRDLSSRVTLTSQLDGWRIVWVDPADKLSRGAANALLKILEEPPQRVLFLLVVDELQRLLPTIRSRCQQLKVQLPSRAEAQAWLAQQPQAAELTPESLQDWLALSQGSPLDVIKALSADEEVPNALELSQQRQLLLESLIDGQSDLISVADGLLALDDDIDEKFKWLHYLALDLLKCRKGLNIDFCSNRRASTLLSRLAPHVAEQDVLNYLEKVGQIRKGVRGNVNIELSLQSALLPWTNRLRDEAASTEAQFALVAS